MRQLKLQPRLKEQRSTLTDWLREHLEHPPLLAAVLAGEQAELSAATAGREVVLAYQQWLLDDAHDGHRRSLRPLWASYSPNCCWIGAFLGV